MSKLGNHEGSSIAERLEKLEKAVRSLGNEIATKVMNENEEHLQRIERSMQKKMSQVEQSVASLQKEVKGKPTSNRAVFEAMQAKKTIKYSFTGRELSTSRHLKSQPEEIGGAKWSICIIRDLKSPFSIFLSRDCEDEVISHDTSFIISVNVQNKYYCQEFAHRYKDNGKSGDHKLFTNEELTKWKNCTFSTKIDLTVFLSPHMKYPQEVVDKFCSSGSFPFDCALVLGDRKVYVNKGLLSVYSKQFHSFFKENTGDEAVLEQLDAAEFCQFLQVIYPRKSQGIISAENVECLLKMAERFDAPAVLDLCERFLLDSPDCFTNAKKMLIADEYDLKNLLAICVAQFKSKL